MDSKRYAEMHLKYTAGDCHIMALALNREFGYRIHVLWDLESGASEGHCLPEDPGMLMHWFVMTPDGRAMDVNGISLLEDMREAWGLGPEECLVTQHEAREVWMRCPPEEGEIDEALEVFRSIHLMDDAAVAPSPAP